MKHTDDRKPGMTTYYQDAKTTLYVGDALMVLETLAAQSVNCIVTSPPYFGLRSYTDDPAEMGKEATPAEFVVALVSVLREARRVLADDGTLWLNLGDSYASGSRTSYADTGKSAGRIGTGRRPSKLPGKNLLGIPWRVAFALQDDGWILRNDIIWNKTNAKPESVKDRMAARHEYVFMFSKKPRYWFDLDPVREEQSPVSVARAQRADHRTKSGWSDAYHGNPPKGLAKQSARNTAKGKNPGTIWNIATVGFKGAHFATMPPKLAERCILAGCEPGGVVLDPFSGVGTSGMAALRNGRRYVGIDLDPEALALGLRTRLKPVGVE